MFVRLYVNGEDENIVHLRVRKTEAQPSSFPLPKWGEVCMDISQETTYLAICKAKIGPCDSCILNSHKNLLKFIDNSSVAHRRGVCQG